MPVVVDCSVAVKWLFVDQATPAMTTLLRSLEDEILLVPDLWLLEVGNALLVAERRGACTADDSDKFLHMLLRMKIEIDHAGYDRALRVTTEIARVHRTTTYDASYLELARRTSTPLATVDAALGRAAKAMGLTVLSA